MNTIVGLLAVFALVFINGFFVAAEFAFVGARRTRIAQLAAEGHSGALQQRAGSNQRQETDRQPGIARIEHGCSANLTRMLRPETPNPFISIVLLQTKAGEVGWHNLKP